MAEDREDRIRTRAHEIWEAEGRPEGREAAHWTQAEGEMGEEVGDYAEAVTPEEGPATGTVTGARTGGEDAPATATAGTPAAKPTN